MFHTENLQSLLHGGSVVQRGFLKQKILLLKFIYVIRNSFLKYIEFGCNILRSPCINMAKGRKGETKC